MKLSKYYQIMVEYVDNTCVELDRSISIGEARRLLGIQNRMPIEKAAKRFYINRVDTLIREVKV